MHLLPSENEVLISDSAGRLLQSFPIEARRRQWHGEWLQEAYRQLADAGMLEVGNLPDADHEGVGNLVAFAIQLGRTAVAIPFTTGAVAAAYLLAQSGRGSEAAAIREGRALQVVAGAESHGSLKGLFDPTTTLTGKRLVGRKSVVSFACEAGHLLVTAKASDGSLRLIQVSADQAGITRLDSVTGEPLYEVALDLQVSDAAVLAAGQRCTDLLKAMLTRVLLVQSAILVGGAERALEIVTEHVIHRQQFGQPLGAFQAVQHHIANSRMRLDASRLMTYELAWRFGQQQHSLLAWAAETKLWISGATGEILRRAHELQGGISVTDEHETMLLLRRNLSESISWGARAELLSLTYPLRAIPPTIQPLFESAS